MPIRLANDTPSVEHIGWRANFVWPLEQPWDELRLAAFLMTKTRRKSTEWTRRVSPFYAVLGAATVECAVPVASPASLPELGASLTAELKGIITGASRIYDDIVAKQPADAG